MWIGAIYIDKQRIEIRRKVTETGKLVFGELSDVDD